MSVRQVIYWFSVRISTKQDDYYISYLKSQNIRAR